MIVRELITKIGFAVDDAGIKKANGLTAMFKGGMKGAALGVAAAVAAIGIASIGAASKMEGLVSSLDPLVGGGENATRMIKELGAMGGPFELEAMTGGAAKLLAFGTAQDQIIPAMRTLGDLANGNADNLASITEAYGKVKSTGKVTMREMMSLSRSGIPINQELAKVLGVSTDQVAELAAKGQISAATMEKAFQNMTGEGGQFFKSMEKNSQDFEGFLVQMKTQAFLVLSDLGAVLMPSVKTLMKLITDLISGPVGELLKAVAEMIQPLLDILLPIIMKIMEVLAPLTVILKVVFSLIMGLLTPILSILDPILDLVIELVEMIAELFVGLQPILDMFTRIFGIGMQVYMKILGVQMKLLIGYFRIWFKIVGWIVKAFTAYLLPVIEWVVNKFEAVWKWFERLLNLSDKQKTQSPEAMQQQIQNAGASGGVNINNQIEVNAPMGGPNQTGMTPGGAGRAMRDAAAATFSLEMRKLLVAAI